MLPYDPNLILLDEEEGIRSTRLAELMGCIVLLVDVTESESNYVSNVMSSMELVSAASLPSWPSHLQGE